MSPRNWACRSSSTSGILQDALGCQLLRLNDADDGEDSTLDRLPHDGPDPQGEALEDARRQAVTTAIKALPERERLVLSLYYEQELNLKEIGAVLKVTESRACQLHGQALVRLQGAADRVARLSSGVRGNRGHTQHHRRPARRHGDRRRAPCSRARACTRCCHGRRS